jgi:hypothetical protein
MNIRNRPTRVARQRLLALVALLFVPAGIALAAAPAPAPAAPRVLIATQATPYKEAVSAGLTDYLKGKSIVVEVIDVTELDKVEPAKWQAIVLMHTWEMERPPAAVQDFVDRLPSREKLVVHTTSAEGNIKLDGVDAISGASNIVDAGVMVKALAARVEALLPR